MFQRHTKRALFLLAVTTGCATPNRVVEPLVRTERAAAVASGGARSDTHVSYTGEHDALTSFETSAGNGVQSLCAASGAALAATMGGASAVAAHEAQRAMETDSALALGAALAVGDAARVPLVPLVLHNVNSHEQLELELARDGSVEPETMQRLASFFQCRRTGRTHAMSPFLFGVLAALGAQYPGKAIEIISGYRTVPFGVRSSKHFAGRAIDLRVRGVKLTEVRDFVWTRFRQVGVGYYAHQGFIHVDFRPAERDTAWTSTHEDGVYEYNPRWSLKTRRDEKGSLVELHAHEHSAIAQSSADASHGAAWSGPMVTFAR